MAFSCFLRAFVLLLGSGWASDISHASSSVPHDETCDEEVIADEVSMLQRGRMAGKSLATDVVATGKERMGTGRPKRPARSPVGSVKETEEDGMDSLRENLLEESRPGISPVGSALDSANEAVDHGAEMASDAAVSAQGVGEARSSTDSIAASEHLSTRRFNSMEPSPNSVLPGSEAPGPTPHAEGPVRAAQEQSAFLLNKLSWNAMEAIRKLQTAEPALRFVMILSLLAIFGLAVWWLGVAVWLLRSACVRLRRKKNLPQANDPLRAADAQHAATVRA